MPVEGCVRGVDQVTGADHGTDLAAAFATWAVKLHNVAGMTQTLEAVMGFAVQAVGCPHAGICLMRAGGKLELAAATDAVAEAVDQLQLELRQGPVVAALDSQDPVRVPNTGAEEDRNRIERQPSASGSRLVSPGLGVSGNGRLPTHPAG